METSTDIMIFKNNHSKGEMMKIQQIAAKQEYSKKEINFVLAMASRTFRMVS